MCRRNHSAANKSRVWLQYVQREGLLVHTTWKVTTELHRLQEGRRHVMRRSAEEHLALETQEMYIFYILFSHFGVTLVAFL